MPNYLSETEGIELIKRNYIGRLGYISFNCPTIVPITYYYDEDEHSIVGFSTEGHKLKSMRENNSACLLVEEIDSLKKWRTVLINGTFEELKGVDSKFHLQRFTTGVSGILKSVKSKTSSFLSDFSNTKYARHGAIVYRIKIWDITGRYMG